MKRGMIKIVERDEGVKKLYKKHQKRNYPSFQIFRRIHAKMSAEEYSF